MGLLPPGELLTRTSVVHGDERVERIRLIRALTSVGGLSVATTRRVLDVIAQPGTGRVDDLDAAREAEQGGQVHPLDPVIVDPVPTPLHRLAQQHLTVSEGG